MAKAETRKPKGNPRTTSLEQYYTPRPEAQRLTDIAVQLIPDALSRDWIEPAAGTGSFMRAMRQAGVASLTAYDIEPKAEGIKRCDFLSEKLQPGDAVCLTNPPFGRNNSLSVPFFNHLANSCEYIGFIVPRSWRKWSVQNRLDSRFHLLHDEVLSLTYADEHGKLLLSKAGQLQTVFQLWERRSSFRPVRTAEDRGYIRRVTPEEADVALTVFGHSCGRIETDFPSARNATKMYLAVSDGSVIEALKMADLKQYSQNVAFVEALSMAEVRAALNQVYDGRT